MSNRKTEPESNLLPEPRRQNQGSSTLKSGSLNYKVNRVRARQDKTGCVSTTRERTGVPTKPFPLAIIGVMNLLPYRTRVKQTPAFCLLLFPP